MIRVFWSVTLACAIGSSATAAHAQALAFDWSVRNAPVAGLDVQSVPHAGHDYPANHSIYQNLYANQDAQGLPLSLMLQNDTSPVGGTKDPNALATVLDYVPGMDFVFADIETGFHDAGVLEMVDQVRNHSNPNVADARLGSYADYPGAYDESKHFAHLADRTANDTFYRNSGLDVAQPNLYPYEYYEVHTYNAGGIVGWGTYLAPNKRSALFWAPLERLSVAKRNLPAGDQLIPWLAGFIPWTNYDAPEPTHEDHEALTQHVRLRGADGYYTLVNTLPEDPAYTSAEYREDVSGYWHELDWLFDGGPTPEILNLETDKLSGLQWSGMRQDDQVLFLVSNLGDVPGQADFPELPGVPDFSPVVPIGTHQTFIYALTSPDVPGDYNGSGLVEQGDLDLVLLHWGANWPPAIGAWVNQQPTDDAVVDQNDLDGVLLNWGNSAAAASARVPEPGWTPWLVFVASTFALACRRSRWSDDSVADLTQKTPSV